MTKQQLQTKFWKRSLNTFYALMIFSMIMFLFMSASPVTASVDSINAVGTTGSFASTTVTQCNQGDWVTFSFDSLSASSEFILVQSSVGNNTFATASGQTQQSITIKIDQSGSLTFTLYGYNISSGTASGSALATWLLTATPSTSYNANGITNLIPFFIGLLIAGIIISLAVGRKFM